MSISRWVEKEIVVYLCSEILLGNKDNELLRNIATWINLIIMMLSEKSQTKKEYILYNSIYIKF